MWETVRLVITQWGLAGAMAACIGFFIYILYIDKNKQADKDSAREERLNQMTDKVIDITSEVSKVVTSNTEVFREVTDRLKELSSTNLSDHRFIVEKLEKYSDHRDIVDELKRIDSDMKVAHSRLEDKLNDLPK
jgi:sulfite reductase alpha subunit-like flavoprotein